LAIFAEDEPIPIDLIQRLWQSTGGLCVAETSGLCTELDDLSLATLDTSDALVTLHDVVRDILRSQLGPQRLVEVNRALIDAVAATLTRATPLKSGLAPTVSWWDLSKDQRYLWDHIVEHLNDAGQANAAEALACDLRWVIARLCRSGPAGPIQDLTSATGTPTSSAAPFKLAITRCAHVLRVTDPQQAMVATLLSRLQDDATWSPQVQAFQRQAPYTLLTNRWPLPSRADSSLLQILPGHTDWVWSVAISPDGTWLATGAIDETVRIWDAATGRCRHTLVGHERGASAVVISPDGTWLVSGDATGTVRIWDALTGQLRHTLAGHTDSVLGLAISPDEEWLASASCDGTIRVWETATAKRRYILKGHTDRVHDVAISPDGTWIASASEDQTVRIWDTVTRQSRNILVGHSAPVYGVAIGADGTWLASVGEDGPVRMWDTATWQLHSLLTGEDGAVIRLTVSRNGAWLASATRGGVVQIWDTTTAKLHYSRDLESMNVAINPDGTWLACGSMNGDVRIWDATTLDAGRPPADHARDIGTVNGVAISPDATWLATAGDHGRLQTWDIVTGVPRRSLKANDSGVAALLGNLISLFVGGGFSSMRGGGVHSRVGSELRGRVTEGATRGCGT
jgi:WD40 repeat protein